MIETVGYTINITKTPNETLVSPSIGGQNP
jgi:hypothetical protein